MEKRLENLKRIENPLKKKLYFAGLLTEYLKKRKIIPVVVGGYAVEFYTLGSYTTEDLDIVVEGEEVKEILKEWGFRKIGRIWINPDLDIEVDIVGSSLAGDRSRVSQIEVEGLQVYLIGIEDIILDRLNAWVHWESEEDGRWARQILKLHQGEIDEEYLRKRAIEEGVEDALKKIKNEEI